MSAAARLAHLGKETAVHALMLGTSRPAKALALVALAIVAGLVLAWILVSGLVPVLLYLLGAWPWPPAH